MAVVIQIENLVKRYKELVALDHLNLEVEEGEIFGLLGPNGSGKSTTINCILALLKYDKGTVKVFGREMKPDSYDIKREIGVVMQDVAVFDELTVYENLSFFTVTSDASKEIYLSNNKFIAMDKLIIKPTVTTNTTYFITGPNSTNYGDLDEVGNEEVPNIDPDNSEIENTPQEDLDITEVEVCGAGTTSLLVFQVIGYIILIIKILVPIILIVLGSIDLGKASLSGDDKAVKEAAISFAKRVLVGLIIFFVPTILDFFLGLVEGTTDVSSKYRGCTDCVLNPNNSSKCSPKKLNDNNSVQDGVSSSGKF